MNTLAVQRWPGPTPVLLDGLFAIVIDAELQREAARRQIRLAAREALATVLGKSAADIGIDSLPGNPPRVLLAGAASRIGISFSHEDGHALAAINLHGAVGADIMRVQDIPDWQAVASDYLGPAVSAALQAAADRPRAFANAWSQREAALKFHAQQLSEWQTDLAGVAIPLDLPDSRLAGYIHIARS
jgi:4'-phosphopantetheinyl transferase